jgi:hypothetical protein
MPVKDPGPTVTATRPIEGKPPGACATTRWIKGITASAWPRAIGKVSSAIGCDASSSNTQAETAGSAVSIARILIIRDYDRFAFAINNSSGLNEPYA